MTLANKFIYLLVFIFIFSCQEENERNQNSYPYWNSYSRYLSKNSVAVFNIGNFIKNQYEEIEISKFFDKSELPITIKVGGAQVRNAYLNVIRDKLKNKAIIVSPSELNTLMPLSPRLSQTPHDGVKMPLTLPQHKSYQMIKWINSNILDLTTGRPIEKGNYIEAKKTIHGTQLTAINSASLINKISKQQKKGKYFQNEVTTLLRNQTKDLNIVLLHTHTKCTGSKVTKPTPFTRSQTLPLTCPKKDALINFLDRLVPEAIDLLILSNETEGVAFYKTIPILFTGNQKKNLTHVILNKKKNLTMSYFMPPVKLCHKVFALTKDCNLDQNVVDKDRKGLGHTLIPAMFLGHEIKVSGK